MQNITRIKDQCDRIVSVPTPPGKIVSIVPSQTELLYDLGLEKNIYGITKFCIHPEKIFRTKARVGGTKKLNIQKIIEINPDLIIANKEENTKEELDELMKDFPVWISDVKNLSDALEMIKQIGNITQTESKAVSLVKQINLKFDKLNNEKSNTKTAAYLIWQKPYMAAGADTFISDMMSRCGLINIFHNKKRYPETSIEELKELQPDIIILSSEPYPFKEKHQEEIQNLFSASEVVLADGEMFSWYGSRLLKAADYLGAFRRQYIG